VVDAGEQGFDFLGFSICWRTSRRSGKRYPHTEPSKRSQQGIKQRVTELTARRRTSVPLPVLVNEANQALRGWSGYFHYRNCTKVFGRIKMHAEERLRTQLRRRHKRNSRAQGRDTSGFPRHICTTMQDCSSFRPLQAGNRCMPWREAHRKDVYGRTVCTD